MYASNLERLLFDLVEQSDASRSERSDMAKRFDSLRRYGRLSQGRENHAALLTDEQIASAIFGLASDRPGWAGHVAIVLANLVPVGEHQPRSRVQRRSFSLCSLFFPIKPLVRTRSV